MTANRASCRTARKKYLLTGSAEALCLVVALLSAAVSAGARQSIKTYQVENAVYKMCVQSDALINARSYAAARDLLLKAAAYDPTSYSAYLHLNLAKCYRGLGSAHKALQEAAAASQFEPESDDALYTMALNYYEMHSFDKALQYLNKLLMLSREPEFRSRAQEKITEIEIYRDMKAANRSMKAGRDSQAITLLKRAAIHDPSRFSADIHASLTYVLQRSGKSEEAIAHGKRALQLDPTDKCTAYTVGIAYQDMGNFDEAISWLRRYVTMELNERERKVTLEFIEELADDRAKQNSSANNSPDYLDQLRANSDVKKWPTRKLPLKVYVSSGKGVQGYRPIFRDFIVRSLDKWCQVSGKKLNYVIVDNAKSADMDIGWTAGRLMMTENSRNRSKAGITYVNSEDDKIVAVKVRITTVNDFSGKLIEDSQAVTVCMHEIGHAFGIGHSSSVKDVMYFGSSQQQPGAPSSRDKTTIARLYADYPIVGFTPKATAWTEPIKYLPPPAFLPPKAPASENIVPPLFMPPPASTEQDKLTPPLFTPPPLPAQEKSARKQQQRPPAAPLFVPPPWQKPAGGPSKSDRQPFFLPAPAQ